MKQQKGMIKSDETKQDPETVMNCSLGTRYTIGRPEKGHYRYLMLYPAKSDEMSNTLLAIDSLVGLMVITKGILKLRDGSKMICLERLDKKPFYGHWTRIYGHFKSGIDSSEIIPL